MNLKILSNQKGMTLAEIMVTTAVTGIIGVMIASVLTTSARMSKRTYNKEQVLQNLIELGFHLKMHFDQAYTIDRTTAATLPGMNSHRSEPHLGLIRETYNSDAWGVVPAGAFRVDTLANFVAETQQSSRRSPPPPLRTRFIGVGVFFQHPTPITSGAVYISTTTTGNANLDVRPTAQSAIFPGLVSLRIESVKTFPGSTRATRAQIHVVGRYFNGSDLGLARWCHPSRMGGALCPNQLPYSDIDRVFDLSFRNNLFPGNPAFPGVNRPGQIGVGLYGPFHLFKSVIGRSQL